MTFFLCLLFASPKDALPPTTPSIIIIIIVVLFLYLVLFPLPFSFLLPLFFSNINPFACSLQVACVFHLRLHEIYKSLHHGRLPTPAPLWSGVCLISSLNDQLIPSWSQCFPTVPSAQITMSMTVNFLFYSFFPAVVVLFQIFFLFFVSSLLQKRPRSDRPSFRCLRRLNPVSFLRCSHRPGTWCFSVFTLYFLYFLQNAPIHIWLSLFLCTYPSMYLSINR